MGAREWMSQIETHAIRDHIAMLPGMERGTGNSWGPCPSCGAEFRASTPGEDSNRRALYLTSNGRGWKCYAGGNSKNSVCVGQGDFADLIALSLFGSPAKGLTPVQMGEMRQVCASNGLCDADSRQSGTGVRKMSGTYEALRKKARRTEMTNRPASPPVSGGPKNDRSPFRWRDTLAPGAARAMFNDPEAEPVLTYLRRVRMFSDDVIRRWGLGAYMLRSGGKVRERWLTIPLTDAGGKVVNVRFRRVPGPCLYCSKDGTTEGSGCVKCWPFMLTDRKTGTIDPTATCDKCPRDGSDEHPTGECRRCKYHKRGRVPHKPKYRVCANRPLPLFGLSTLTERDDPVIIVEGELDVLAMDMYGFPVNVVSTSAGSDAKWLAAWLDVLEPFPDFIIAGDNDVAGDKYAEHVADSLGRDRCARARLPAKDANECLMNGVGVEDVSDALERAQSMNGLTINRVGAYEQDIDDLIKNPAKLVGIQTSVTKFNKQIGGLNPGAHVWTGDTGHGKTTFTTFLCFDVATHQGIPVFITSFEQRPIGSVMKLLRMECGTDFVKITESERVASLKALDGKPIYILDHYGNMDGDQVIKACRYARRRLGCRVQLIDHIGFLTDEGEDERLSLEKRIRELATIGINEDIVFLIICHPNNTFNAQQRRVKLADIKGASAIRQDAHSGCVVERGEITAGRPFPSAVVYADKVRSEWGQADSTRVIAFDPLSLHYADRWEDTPSGAKGIRVVGS